MYHGKTIGVVIPAHNEAQSIGLVVRELAALHSNSPELLVNSPERLINSPELLVNSPERLINSPELPIKSPELLIDSPERLVDKIIVCDNASTDQTAQIATAAGAQVVCEPKKGYGAACLKAMQQLDGIDCIAFVDGDHSMCASELPLLLDTWLDGAHLVIGSRSLGARNGLMEHGSLTVHQRWGNTLASFLLTRLWQTRVTDLGPFRAIDAAHLAALDMREHTFGWTVEMQAKALDQGLRVVEVPVTSTQRIGTSKVSGTWRGSLGASIGIMTTIGKIGGRALLTRTLLARSLKLDRESTERTSPVDT